MEFKDKLKALRKERGLTQAQLAEAIFVSRSTVAKWENGLGMPCEASMEQLMGHFNIAQQQIETTEPEAVIVQKNRKLYLIRLIVFWSVILTFTVLVAMLPFAIHNGNYGFTLALAAGSYADNAYFDTGDYRIYYFQFEGNLDSGQHWSALQGFRPVRKHFWGFTVSEKNYAYRIITKDNYVVGRLYSIQGKNGYYHLLSKAGIYRSPEQDGQPMAWDIPAELITATSITIGDKVYALEQGCFFTTADPVEYFKIGDGWYDVE